MSRKFAYYGSKSGILTPSEIFGADYFDDWDARDNTTLGINGSFVETFTSKGLNGAVFSSSGGNRFTLSTLDGLQCLYANAQRSMHVTNSTAMYNFLRHGANGGVIITISNRNVFSPSAIPRILDCAADINANYGFYVGCSNNYNYISGIRNGVGQFIQVYTNPSTYSFNKWNVGKTIFNFNGVLGNNLIVNSNMTGDAILADSRALTNNASLDLCLGRNSNLTNSNTSFYGGISRIIIIKNQQSALKLSQLDAYLQNEYGIFPFN